MTLKELKILQQFCSTDKWHAIKNILAWLENVEIVEEVKGTRTNQQNNALHKDCALIAEKLNEAGKDWKAIIKEGIDIPVTKDSVKRLLWYPTMKVMYGHESTTQLKKVEEIDAIHETIMRRLMEAHYIEWHDFPHDPDKQKEEMGGYKTNAGNSKGYEYPEYQPVTGLE